MLGLEGLVTPRESSVLHVRGGWTYEEREEGGKKKITNNQVQFLIW